MSRQALIDALRLHLGDESRASVKFQYQLAASPYPSPAYRLVFLGDGGQDVDRTYVSLTGFTGSLDPLRERGIEYVVMKRTNVPNPDTAIIEQTLERDATRVATFSPYREGVPADVQAATEPFFHNTATRIDAGSRAAWAHRRHLERFSNDPLSTDSGSTSRAARAACPC